MKRKCITTKTICKHICYGEIDGGFVFASCNYFLQSGEEEPLKIEMDFFPHERCGGIFFEEYIKEKGRKRND